MITENGILPTDLSDFTITVNGKDISAAVESVVVFQDILSPTWSCEIIVSDTNNLIISVPIKPNTEIEISIESNLRQELNGSKSFNFVVFGIVNKKFINSKWQTYTITGVSKELITNQVTRVRKSYSNQSPSDIASSIMSDTIGSSLDVDSSDNTVTTIVSNLSPFTAINKMCKLALCDNAADMLLFQTDNGKFAMKSIEKMYSDNESGNTFMLRPVTVKDDNGNPLYDLSLCIDDYWVEHYNMMSNLGSGMYASKTVSFDFLTKDFTTKSFKYGDDNQEDGSKKYWSGGDLETPEANISFIPKHSSSHEEETSFDSMDKWAGSRKSSLLKLEQDKLIIQVPGAIKAWEMLGKSYEVDMPSQQSMEENEELDKYFKGKYLCVSVCHIASKYGYWTNIAGVKKRLQSAMT